MESKFLRHINLEEVCTGEASLAKSIPLQLFERVWNACANFILCAYDEKKSNYQIASEVADLIDDNLCTLEAIKKAQKEANIITEQNRVYSSTYRDILQKHEVIEFLEALQIYQLDRLIGLYQEDRFDCALSIIDDLLEINIAIADESATGFIEADREIQNSETQSARARLRHMETNKKKEAVLAEWDASGHEYESRADFARIVGDLRGIKERTLYDWIAAHEKAKA